jgi:hypothetical protein
MTDDSLISPQNNWLFHVHLGILGGFSQVQRQLEDSPMQVA